MRLAILGLLLVLAACSSGSNTAGGSGSASGVYIGGNVGSYYGVAR